MQVSPIKFYSKRELTEAQKQRITSHQASVQVGADGQLTTRVQTIITPKGLSKEVQYKSITPSTTERVMTLKNASELFDELKHINVILTNACNLSCSYCYEQHSHDYGRFTPETLKTVYDFQLNSNNQDGKLFQFFGGEPLIHKQLILDFVEQYKEQLESNSHLIHVSMITNGILLTPAFVDQYFSHSFTSMSISLDTDKSEVDHREIGQDKIEHIFEMIKRIPQSFKDTHQVSIRCTIAIENAPHLREFCTRLHQAGIRAMVIHPLTMSSIHGNMQWPEKEWTGLRQDIQFLLQQFPDFEIQFSEGVGIRGGANCMVGADMIAVDGSGDYSGCYFFTNQKEVAHHTILGNILNDAVYVDRYHTFQKAYDDMFVSNEQCIKCDLKGFCYQCPAGNSDSGKGQLFRPDDMCQRIVKLFIQLQDDISRKSVLRKFNELKDAVAEHGEDYVFKKSLTHLLFKHITGHHISDARAKEVASKVVDYRSLVGYFKSRVESELTVLPWYDNIAININSAEPMEVKDLYEWFQERKGKPTTASKSAVIEDSIKRTFFLTMLHMLFLNDKGDSLDKPIRIIKL